MNVLSLFDGISCGMVALERAGISVNKYYASEIDKFALAISNDNYPDIIRLGDVLGWRSWPICWHKIDLILAGFPCQAWSVAGKQMGVKDERGKLFWVMLDVMQHIKRLHPDVKFIVENVRMKRDFEEYITGHIQAALGDVHKILINSSLVSAQTRNRYYWTNFKVEQPNDREILLADILEGDTVDREKCLCIVANYHKGGNLKQYFTKRRRQIVFREKNKTIRAGGRNSYGRHEWDSVSDCHYRKLTPIECERLQTLPDNYTAAVSNTQRYKALGNAFTVEVIAHILRELRQNLRLQSNADFTN